MNATTAQLEAVLSAAQHVLGARQDEMLTVEEWAGLARAVAACTGRKAADLLTPRDLEQAADYDLAWDQAVDGPLGDASEGGEG